MQSDSSRFKIELSKRANTLLQEVDEIVKIIGVGTLIINHPVASGRGSLFLRTLGSQRSLSLAALLHGEPTAVPRPPPLLRIHPRDKPRG